MESRANYSTDNRLSLTVITVPVRFNMGIQLWKVLKLWGGMGVDWSKTIGTVSQDASLEFQSNYLPDSESLQALGPSANAILNNNLETQPLLSSKNLASAKQVLNRLKNWNDNFWDPKIILGAEFRMSVVTLGALFSSSFITRKPQAALTVKIIY